MATYLDTNGVQRLWSRIQQLVYECRPDVGFKCINDNVETTECFEKAVRSVVGEGGGASFSADNILAGENITLEKSNGNVTINATASGGEGNNFVVLRGTISSVPNRTADNKVYSASELESLGIDDIDNYAVVSVKQSDPFSGGYRYGGMFGTNISGVATYTNSYPLVTTNSNGGLSISVLNTNEATSGTADISYQIVLARIESEV